MLVPYLVPKRLTTPSEGKEHSESARRLILGRRAGLWLTALLASVAAGPLLAFPWYASGEGIWGAEMLNAEERSAYVRGLQSSTSREACEAHVAAHRQRILERAQARGIQLPPPPASPCATMERMGRFRPDAPACPAAK